MHDRDERVGGGLGPEAHPLEVLLNQVPDEGGLARAVLAHEEHHGLVEVGVLQRWRVELMEAVMLLQRAAASARTAATAPRTPSGRAPAPSCGGHPC